MNLGFYKDLGERVAWTFVQGFAASVIITGNIGFGDLKLAAVAGALAVAKCLVAVNIGSKDAALPGA